MKKEYSVLMAVYEKEDPAFLRESFESMKGQTLPFSDFVLVCDGPLNEGLDAVIREEQEELGDQLQVVCLPENGGLGKALAAGLPVCRCPVVARMDSDDISRPDRCEKEYQMIRRGYDLVGCSVEEFDRTPGDTGRLRSLPETNKEIRHFAHKRNPFNHGTVMFRKEKVLEAGSYQDFSGFEDYCLWIRMLKRGCRGWNLPEALVDMRIGNGLSGRRGGRGYVRSVVRFQRFLLREGVTTPADFVMNCGVRIAVGLMPDGARDRFYKTFLRRR